MQPDCRTWAAWSRRARRAPASRTPPWRARWAWASCLAASGSLRPLLLRVRDHAAAGAGAINPTCARERIGDGLGIFMSTDDRESIEVAISVDEVLPARRARVGLVRNVGERN